MIFNWNEEKNSIDFLNNTKKFERTRATQSKYDEFLSDYTDHKEIYQNIIEKKLPINSEMVYGIPGKVTLRKNCFPYDFGGHYHYILWLNPKCTDAIKNQLFTISGMNNIIDKLLENAPDNLRTADRIVFRNAIQNKSVLLVEHFHIVFKASL